jgi:arsenate reductase
MNILFMCVANSARSQLAEAVARQIFGKKVQVQSAGSRPTKVNPLAVEVMKESGYDLMNHSSKTIDQLPKEFLASLDFVITLCAEEVCPVLPSKTATKVHWPMPDPAGKDALAREAQLQVFRNTRDELRNKLLSLKADLKI